jgi:glyoxylase-like metal-dependent hydrolase (beta-lactamase superfamily II)
MLNRRQMMAGLAATTLGAGRGWAQRIALGPFEVISLSDGHLDLPGAMLFGDAPQAELMPILQAHGVDYGRVEAPCNLTLLRAPGVLALFDAGSGSGFMPSAGRLPGSLAALGVGADEITHVIFTHAHPDHLWGVLDDFDDPVFPEAQFMIAQEEWAFWTDPETLLRIDPARTSFAVGAARRLSAIQEQMMRFKGGDEILPGVLAHATPGHTPGHMAFEIRSGSDAVLVGGDAIGNGHVAFAHPDWPSGTDHDPAQGAKTRARLLDMLAAEQMRLLGFHLPGGGLGRVERRTEGYQFVQGA